MYSYNFALHKETFKCSAVLILTQNHFSGDSIGVLGNLQQAASPLSHVISAPTRTSSETPSSAIYIIIWYSHNSVQLNILKILTLSLHAGLIYFLVLS